MGQYGRAEALHDEALPMCEHVLGREHPETLASLNNLALLYDKQGGMLMQSDSIYEC